MYTNFSEKLTFLTPWYAHVFLRIRGQEMLVFNEIFAHVLYWWRPFLKRLLDASMLSRKGPSFSKTACIETFRKIPTNHSWSPLHAVRLWFEIHRPTRLDIWHVLDMPLYYTDNTEEYLRNNKHLLYNFLRK